MLTKPANVEETYMPDPSETMQSWIADRITDVVTQNSHTWPTTDSHSLKLWTLAVENHHNHAILPDEHTILTDHYSEPPIPLAIGYLALIGLQIEDRDDLVGVEQTRNEALGYGAVTLHPGMQISLDPPDHTSAQYSPLQTFREWISGRIWYAAAKQGKWSDELTSWSDCVKERGGDHPHRQPPTPMALGYIIHAACHFLEVPHPGDVIGAGRCVSMGHMLAAADATPDPWMQDCPNT